MLDLPRARDRLAEDFEANTAPTDDDDVRVYIGAGVLLPVIALRSSPSPTGRRSRCSGCQ